MKQQHNPQKLALKFARLRRENQSGQHLALALGRDTTHDTPDLPPQPEVPIAPRKTVVGMDYAASYSATGGVATCRTWFDFAKPLAFEFSVHDVDVIEISGCLNVQSEDLARFDKSFATNWGNAPDVSGCLKMDTPALHDLHNAQSAHWQPSQREQACVATATSSAAKTQDCATSNYAASVEFVGCTAQETSGSQAIHACQKTALGKAPQVPCEWYPIILPPPKDERTRPCGERPKGNAVRLNMSRHKVRYSPTQIPLPLSCNVDFKQIPPLDTYMILNKITAKCGEIALNPLSASARADMGGYCWMCELTLPPDDFFALNLEQTQLGQEKIIELAINDDVFVFMAENISDNRRFAQRNYTVSGRSLTAKLGADYALGRNGVIEQDLYASQIAQQQVADLGFTLEWKTVDWLIQSNTYTLTDKSPIAVIMDLAQACGAFVYSHPSEPKLFVLPKWREAAWNVPTASPALIVPSNIILQISGQKNVQTQCHGVYVFGTGQHAKGAHVVRSGSDGLPETSALSHAVYTDLIACQAAGVAALSKTGTHKSETITLPVAKKYNLGIAEIGRIWRFNEPNGAWNAVIQGVSVSVSVEGDVPVVKQTVTADRYLGT
ncbi:hypothetical protein [Wielerella bovis]|uniref:hypothetical protein n=1 Tax=Wielerella bovis TaxID=2917790 RepID=UPI0020194013|nr:hypothetical protein [Wielerella bovis]ULJ61071.1 hypothetical protein MIS44_04235 [Wielerella bovis]